MINQLILNCSPLEVLGLTLIGEVRGEHIEGQVAVGCDIRNRLHGNPTKYKNYSDVCLEPEQYSCWNLNDINYKFLLQLAEELLNSQAISDPYLRQCLWVAQGISDWSIVDNTRNSLHYMTTSLFNSDKRPSWAKNATGIIVIDNQTFFNVK